MFANPVKRGLSHMANLELTNAAIKKELMKYTFLKSLTEYVWNGFDAGATTVDVRLTEGELGNIVSLSIKDNGNGINRDHLSSTFARYMDSAKSVDSKRNKHSSEYHGKRGIGRLSFICFASHAEWETVYSESETGENHAYTIEIDGDNPREFSPGPAKESDAPLGTIVQFYNVRASETKDDIIKFLKEEFCWHLELNAARKTSITVNGLPIDYSDFVIERDSFTRVHEISNTVFQIRFVHWRHSLHNKEYSRFYYLNDHNVEKYTEYTSLNRQGDDFFHSVFISSPLFNEFVFETNDEISFSMFPTKQAGEYRYLMEEVLKYLEKKQKACRRKNSKKLIQEYKDKKFFPPYDDSDDFQRLQSESLEGLLCTLYEAEPKIYKNLNDIQKVTFVRFLDLIMNSQVRSELFDLLSEIIELQSEERTELCNILKTAKLSNVIKMLKLVQDRQTAVNDLKQLLFNPDLKANEVHHLQFMIEQHYWIFGEQYHLVTAAEPNFEEAFRRCRLIITGESTKTHVDHEGRLRQMDIFALRKSIYHDHSRAIVAELKHPSVTLGKKEVNQVTDYLEIIESNQELNALNCFWEYLLVGNRFDSSGFVDNLLETNMVHGEPGLIQKTSRHKIYVKTWATIFEEFEIKHKYLYDELQLNRKLLMTMGAETAEDILCAQVGNSAVQPDEFIG